MRPAPLVATQDGSASNRPSLFRCNLDGTSCHHSDVSAGAGANSGAFASIAIDAASGTIVIATDDSSKDNQLGLFVIH